MAPKPPGQRRRRNAGQAQWRRVPAEGRQGDPPMLLGEDWLPSTRESWETVWASPMATVYEAADVDGLGRLAHPGRVSPRRPASGALGAMQALEDRYGLNPRSRRMLQWEIARGEVHELPDRKQPRKLRAIEPEAG